MTLTNLSLMPKKYFSFIYSLNYANNLVTTMFSLQYAAKCNEIIILYLQEPGLESYGLPPHYDPLLDLHHAKNLNVQFI
jgi:hypothetical protein